MFDSASDDVNKQRKTRVAINAIAAWFKIFHRSKEPNKFCRYEVMITVSLHKAKDLKYMKTRHVNSNYRSVNLIKSEICLNFLKYIHDTDAKIGDKVED